MLNVVFVDSSGLSRELAAAEGDTLMETAIAHDLPGIVGFCGGMCRCGTCHCYIGAEWAKRLPEAGEDELDTLRRVLDRRPDSRLGCQIELDASLDGLTVELPRRQPPT